MKIVLKVDEMLKESEVEEFDKAKEKLGEYIVILYRTLMIYDNLFVDLNK